ncbi:MAG: hypothetical protein HFI64_03525 [Lachnospiraceae bacterium]|nr:hypothetical protein [Lachnospiraceae bacterium]
MSQNTARKIPPQYERRDSVARLRERKLMKRRRRRNQKILLCVSVLVLCGGSFWLGRITAPKARQGEKGGGSRTAAVGGITTLDGRGSAESGGSDGSGMTAEEMSRYVENHPGEYPEFLRSFLESTPEAAEFVYHYPEYKDRKAEPVDLSGECAEGEVPLFIQWDKRWGYEVYGDDLMALSGCGPTCLSMVYVGLTGDTDMDPGTMAEFASDNGYYLEGVGTSWELMSSGAERLGLSWGNPALSKETVFAELDAGHPLICSMQPGDFTTTGHFIVIYGREGDRLLLHDPNSPVRSEKKWPYEQVEGQIKNIWSYSRRGTEDIWKNLTRVQEHDG